MPQIDRANAREIERMTANKVGDKNANQRMRFSEAPRAIGADEDGAIFAKS